jgi:hypothetical protein
VEFLFLYDFLRNVAQLYLGKFRSYKGCHEVEIGEINDHEGSRTVPGVFEFVVMEELLVFQGLSGFHVDNSVGTVAAFGKEASGNAVIVRVGQFAPA